MSLSKWRILALMLVVACAAPLVATTVSAQSYQCASSNDELAFAVRRRVVQVVTAGTDTGSVATRAMYNLPSTTAAKVTYVTTGSTCVSAGQLFYVTVGNPPSAADTLKVLVLKVGTTRFVVYSLGYHAGEFSAAVTFDSKWHALGNVSF